MDLYDHQNHLPISHYETIDLKKNWQTQIQKTKEIAFYYMDQLEGWCTKNKASLLIDLIFMLKPETIVEIGVWGGKSLVPMAYALKIMNNGMVYGIDPWDNEASIQEMEGDNFEWWSNVNHEMIFQGLKSKISEFDLDDRIELIRATSERAPSITNIDILHIDGNHGENASTLDVMKWVPLVRKGGVIIFDDMTWGTNANAVKWLNNNCIRFVDFHEDNDWGIWIKP